ncbi:hypothetical protein HY251_10450 [bacterium]|nr:hypothetical protein [bacterium]
MGADPGGGEAETLRADEEAPADGQLESLRAHKQKLEATLRGSAPFAPGTSKPAFWKRTYVVDWKLQLSYAGLYVATLALLVAGVALSNVIFLSLVRNVEAARKSGSTATYWWQADDLGYYVVLNVVILIFVGIGMAVWAIVQSHKIAGPVLRFRRALKQLLRRDYDFQIVLRKGDHLVDMAEDVNSLTSGLKAKDLVVAHAAIRLHELASSTPDREKAVELREISDQLSTVVLPRA